MHRCTYWLVGCSLAFVMAGCSTAADGYVTAPATALHSSANAGHHVTGSGHVPIGMTDDLREFTFHAIEHPDGSVTGSYKVERTDTGAYFIVDVTCMSVVKNTAWIAGRISETNTASVRVGTVSYFWAEDGGEGADAQDIVSNARINDRDGADVDFCNTRPTRLAPLRVEMGNVQIR